MATFYELARDAYARLGVDAEAAIDQLGKVPISVHCWQGDDVAGFENTTSLSGGGIQATGNFPGKATTIAQLRQDLEKVYSLLPGRHRLNLHASYGDFGGKSVSRTDIGIEHFQSWIDWCKTTDIGFDFNPTYFAHPLADDGFTLSNRDRGVRDFWIEHGKACRRISAAAGEQLGETVVTNFWVPDAYKDTPFDRASPRERLQASLDEIFSDTLDPKFTVDAVESKLFGLGAESYTVGSHEFYLGYAISRQKLYCLDAGHFHPTESIGDKISSILKFVPEMLLHVSRGVRWDSDHVVIMDDQTRGIMEEVVRGGFLPRTHIGLDFFDASINRIAAWVIGVRSTQKCVLSALLEPATMLRNAEESCDFTTRLALLEEAKILPLGAVWDEFCRRNEVPTGTDWLMDIKDYEATVLNSR